MKGTIVQQRRPVVRIILNSEPPGDVTAYRIDV